MRASRSSDPYRELFERSADAILVIEGDRFVDCNAATLRMLGYDSKEALLRTHPSEVSPPTQPDGRDSFEKANEMIAIAFEQGSHRFEWDHQRADGEVFPVEVLLTAIRDGDRRTLHVVWRDITGRKRLEDQLRQSQKMEAVGQLAGGIAHDFNNLLVAIIGNASLLEDEIEDLRALNHVREIGWAGERAAELVGQLLAFSRKQVLKPVTLDLNVVLGDLERLLQRIIGEDIELRLVRAGEPVLVKADPVQIEQVVVNLVTNARDAMESGGGGVLLETAETVLDALPARVTDLPPGRYATIRVTDTGRGMDETTRRRAFEPFFTTKPRGEGTGLGLSTVYGIVKQSGGDVVVRSAVGEGTNVAVHLPRAASEGPAAEIVGAQDVMCGGDETVLVVEDEVAVAALVAEVLDQVGYDVLVAGDGLEALGIFESRAGEIDLVLTDVVMPRMGGPDLVRELRERGHVPRVLYASGYTDDALQHRGILVDGVELLSKPFRPRDLLLRVRKVLDAAVPDA